VCLVVDPGVLVSALITPLGPPAQLWQAARAGTVQFIVSPRLLAELAGVLEREKFRRYVSLEEARQFVSEVTDLAVAHADPEAAPKATPDPDDDYLVALARAAGTEAIVSGDNDLTDQSDLDPPVLTPRQVLDRLARDE
jgi:putative PIN family toxin of toxin-antitoxin system